MTEDAAATAPQTSTAAEQLSSEIKRLRREAGLSQRQLAARIGYTRQYMSHAERNQSNLIALDFIKALDSALGANGNLIQLRERARLEQQILRKGGTLSGARPQTRNFDRTYEASSLTALAKKDDGGGFSFATPSGRYFAGSIVNARVYSASHDGRILVDVPPDFVHDQFLNQPRRSLVIGATNGGDGPQLYGLDSRQAKRRLTHAAPGARLLMPKAYELDDLTLGILWSVASMDESLLHDDALLSASQEHLREYDIQSRSSMHRENLSDLTTLSQMWLGSEFCASHILRHLGDLGSVPTFWTREQRGEEASTWLFFSHKFDYLREVADRYRDTGISPKRVFCIPPTEVLPSARHERVLLLLSVALMESFGITVEVCSESEYTSLDGFVLDANRQAVVANWVGTENAWKVDVTRQRSTMQDFNDAIGYAGAHSIVTGSTPTERLRELSDYLELDWTWLTHRTAQLGDYGCAGLAAPHSRLLSTEGLDRACRYLGEMAPIGDR